MLQLSRRSRCGHVVTDAQQPGYIGAERSTNNTGELTAIAQALEYILTDHSGREVLVCCDSLYAGNMAAGKWRPRKNKVLVSHVRRLWTRAHTHLHGRLRGRRTSTVTATTNGTIELMRSRPKAGGAPQHEVHAAGVGSTGEGKVRDGWG